MTAESTESAQKSLVAQRLKSRQIRSRWLRHSLTALVISLLFFFLLLPIWIIVERAFVGKDGFTLAYFSLFFKNELYQVALFNSIKLGLTTTFFVTLVALPLALINSKYEYPGKGLLSSLLLVSMVVPPFVGTIGIQHFFAQHGPVNTLLMDWGLISAPIGWFNSEHVFWSVVTLETLHLYPTMYLSLSAALANVDPSLEEMGRTLGAGYLKRCKDILWPLVRPGFFSAAIIIFIRALTDLGIPLLVGYQDVLSVRIFNLITDIHENPLGYTMVLIVLVMTVSFFFLSKSLLGKRKKYQMMSKSYAARKMVQTTWQKNLIIYPIFITVIALSFIPHIGIVLTSISDTWFMTFLPEKYTLHYYATVLSNGQALHSIKNSLMFASVATMFNMILGLFIAYVVHKKLLPFGKWLDGLVMLPLALPGIVLTFGYIVTYTDTWFDPFKNPIPLLLLFYCIRYIPYSVRLATAGLQQMNPQMEEASTAFGASSMYTLWKITAPLVMANVVAAGLLSFSRAVLEVSGSLMLAMKESCYPLTKAIYGMYFEQGGGEMKASALGMVGMGIITLSMVLSRRILGKKTRDLFKL